MTQRPPFPTVLDNTIIGTYKTCPQKAFRQYFQHWKSKESSVHLEAGGALAAGLEKARVCFYREKMSADDSMAEGLGALIKHWGNYEAPPDAIKQFDRTCGAFEYYFTVWPLGVDRAVPHDFGHRHGVEFSFAEPLDTCHPETGDPILYVGRADMVADYAGGIFTFDEKTTSRLGPTWVRQWDLRAQFIGYAWGLRTRGIRSKGTVVRGVSILKNGYDKAEAIIYHSEAQIASWKHVTERTVRRMIQDWKDGEWDFNFDSGCTQYSGCGLRRVCLAADPEGMLRQEFKYMRWDPVNRALEEGDEP